MDLFLKIAKEIYNTFKDIDEIWLIPCGDGRNDKKLKTEGNHRIEMLKLILLDLIDEGIPIKVNK